jgi:hypothetical protein
MPDDFVSLVENVRWGTQGVLYRVKNYQTTLQDLPARLHLQLRKSGKLVAARIAIRKSVPKSKGTTNAFYHSLFSVDPSEQGKGYGKLLARCTLDYLAKSLQQSGFIYAYIEEGNARSAGIAASLGYRRFGQFYAHPISRLLPRSSPRVHRLADEEQRQILLRLLEDRYTGHALTDFSLSFNANKYWVLYEHGRPIAGAQVSEQIWQIEKLPGLSGILALNVVSRVPLARTLFNPKAWCFIKIGNIYFQPNRTKAFFELLEDLLYRYGMKTAALYIDHRSPIFEELRASNFGILDPLIRTKVDVWGFLEHLSQNEISELHSRPLAISAVDI